MAALIDDLLNLSRMSRGSLRKEPVSLTKLAQDVVAELQSRETSRHVAVEIADDAVDLGDRDLDCAGHRGSLSGNEFPRRDGPPIIDGDVATPQGPD